MIRLYPFGDALLGMLRLRKRRDPDDQAAKIIQDLKQQVVTLEQNVHVLQQENASLGQRVIQIHGRAETAERDNRHMREQLSRMGSENERMRVKADEIERVVDDTRTMFEQLEQYYSRLELELGEEVSRLRSALAASESEKEMLRTLLRSLLPRGRGSRAMRSLPAPGGRGPGRWNREGGCNTDESDS